MPETGVGIFGWPEHADEGAKCLRKFLSAMRESLFDVDVFSSPAALFFHAPEAGGMPAVRARNDTARECTANE